MTESSTPSALKNVAFNTIGRIITLVAQAATNIILTRLLLPRDYGIFGFALILINFFLQFGNMGINTALVQKRDLTTRDLNTGLSIRSILGFGFFILLILAAPLCNLFLHDSSATRLVRILAFNLLIPLCSFIPMTLLTRELNYRVISFVNTLSSLTGYLVSIVLGLFGFGFWSLVAGNLASGIVSTIVLVIFKPHPIHFAWDAGAARSFMRYGSTLFSAGLFTFAIFNADNFIIGAMKGTTELGYYELAFNWATVVCTQISSLVLSIIFPTISRFQHDRPRLRAAYLKVLEYIAFLGIPLYVSLYLFGYEFLFLILGGHTDKWLPALGALRILCIYGVIRLLLEPLGNFILALGRPGLLLRANMLAGVIELALLYPFLHIWGIRGVALVITFAYVLQYFVLFPPLMSELNLATKHIVNCVRSPLLASFAICIPSLYLIKPSNALFPFALKCIAFLLTYLFLTGMFTQFKLLRNICLMPKAIFSDKSSV